MVIVPLNPLAGNAGLPMRNAILKSGGNYVLSGRYGPFHSYRYPSRKEDTMPGIQVFKTLADALRAGYSIYDRTRDGGYLVRIRTASGWAQAIVTPSN